MQNVDAADKSVDSSTTNEAKPSTSEEFRAALEASGFIGMWADRTDIDDSVAFARELRRRAQIRTSE
jgi:hypothetical protein